MKVGLTTFTKVNIYLHPESVENQYVLKGVKVVNIKVQTSGGKKIPVSYISFFGTKETDSEVVKNSSELVQNISRLKILSSRLLGTICFRFCDFSGKKSGNKG